MPDRTESPLIRFLPWAAAAALLLLCVWFTTQSLGVDPTETPDQESRTTVVVDAAIIVFREGLEAILIFAAVTASFLGGQPCERRPVAAGAGIGLRGRVAHLVRGPGAARAASPLGAQLEAITGFLAIVVLLIVLNWFVHKVYWSDRIGKHHKRRAEAAHARPVPGRGDRPGRCSASPASTARDSRSSSSSRTCELQSGTATVLEGVAIGLACTAVVGVLTFGSIDKLPYRRMLILTGVMVGFVLMVMIGGTALSFQDLGWMPSTPSASAIPGWAGRWFEIYPTVETIACQIGAAALVVGSYFAAEHVKVRRRPGADYVPRFARRPLPSRATPADRPARPARRRPPRPRRPRRLPRPPRPARSW